MSFHDYLKDKAFIIILNIVSMILAVIYLLLIKVSSGQITIIITVWVSILLFYLIVNYYKRKKYLNNLINMCKRLEQKYLISEVLENPQLYDDTVYAEILRLACKSMMEEITKVKHERKEYKEYIEQWVHEIKTPIAAIGLICENNKSETTERILSESKKTENLIEQVLFYARSETVEKDFIIKEIPLSDIIKTSVVDNKKLLISNGVNINITAEDFVYIDEKWLIFIINQLIINSVKYGANNITFASKNLQSNVVLSILDDGIGINASDLPRIFDKGFVGENGRHISKSTGIGLYLCKKLCLKLGLSISADSVPNEYTNITISFPKGSFVKL